MWVLLIWVLPIVVFVFFSIRQRRSGDLSQDSTSNSVAIHKARLQQLQTEFESGGISEDEFESFRLEEEKALLADSELIGRKSGQSARLSGLWIPVLSVLVFGVAVVTYGKIGALDAVQVQNQFRALSTSEQVDESLVSSTLESYQKLLERDPENIEGWFRLARMQIDVGLYDDSIKSLKQVLSELRTVEHNAQDEAVILTYIGQSYAALSQMEPALSAFEESLQYDQSNTALGMAGRMSFELGQYQKSIDYWTRLKFNNPQADEKIIDNFIDQAVAQLKAQGVDYIAEEPTRIIVNIALPAAWEGLSSSATLFVYARPIGQRMPLAVKRLPISGQSITVMLSDADAMGPMGGISGQETVEVTARVSLTGIANTQPGDWGSESKQVTLDITETVVDLKIAQP